jgi:hypothetical protein
MHLGLPGLLRLHLDFFRAFTTAFGLPGTFTAAFGLFGNFTTAFGLFEAFTAALGFFTAASGVLQRLASLAHLWLRLGFPGLLHFHCHWETIQDFLFIGIHRFFLGARR